MSKQLKPYSDFINNHTILQFEFQLKQKKFNNFFSGNKLAQLLTSTQSIQSIGPFVSFTRNC